MNAKTTPYCASSFSILFSSSIASTKHSLSNLSTVFPPRYRSIRGLFFLDEQKQVEEKWNFIGRTKRREIEYEEVEREEFVPLSFNCEFGCGGNRTNEENVNLYENGYCAAQNTCMYVNKYCHLCPFHLLLTNCMILNKDL